MTLQSGVKSASRPASAGWPSATFDPGFPLYYLGTYRVKRADGSAEVDAEETAMIGLSHQGWRAAERLGTCVICGQPAILRSPKGRSCHWTCALAWVSEHQDHGQQERAA